jgi:uncharacterized Zn-binding protein involved in type VI secretion
MPAAARGNGVDSVFSRTGTGRNCNAPIGTTTGFVDCTVIINGHPGVKQGDPVAPHPFSGCGVDTSTLSGSSGKVMIEGRGAGRIGDEYTPDNVITSGSTSVFMG